MAPPNSQANRIGRLYTPLPENTLSLMSFSGLEAVNEINNFKVKAVAPEGPVVLDDLLGQPMRIELDSVYGTIHHIHQAVFSARFLGKHDRGYVYEFDLRPWIWLLGRQTNSRIFSHKTVIDIIKDVMAGYAGFFQCPVKYLSSDSFPILKYTVQFGETDLDFILRLMEQFNISYFVEMTESGQTLVLVTSLDDFAVVQGPATRVYNRAASANQRDAEVFDHWIDNRLVTATNFRTDDYNFETPTADLSYIAISVPGHGLKDVEAYAYPGLHLTQSEAETTALNKMKSGTSQSTVVRATGDLRSLAAGVHFALIDHEVDVYNTDYAVIAIQHMYTGNQFQSGGGAEQSYHGSYRLVTATTSFGPERKTPRPVMRGPQTAVVTDGADSTVDEYGRIVVRFHWDKTATSMPCRVAQMWAGKEWGSVFTPHVGMEVIVEFLDGDPDRPVVTGCVYNADNMPPWSLPDKKLTSGILTVRDNWLLFDDTNGAELIDIHGQKDFKTLVENDHKLEVGNDSVTIIHNNEDYTVDGERKTEIGKTDRTTVQGTLTLESKTKIILKVAGSTITLEPGGIKIEATKIDVAATAALTTKGLTAEHTATANMTIKGLMVLIN